MGAAFASPAVRQIHSFVFHGESFVSVIDLLQWIDGLLTEGEISPLRRSALAWLQYSFDQLRSGPQADIRSWQRNGVVFASAADLLEWIDKHPATLEAEEKAAVADARRKIVAAMSSPRSLSDERDNVPYQMFREYMDIPTIKLCCRWALMVQWDELSHERFSPEKPLWLTYLFDKRIRLQVKAKNVRRAILAAVGQIAATPTAPHYAAAVIALDKNMVLNDSAFDAIDPMAGFDENAIGSVATDAQRLADFTKPSQSRYVADFLASALRLAKLTTVRRIDSFVRWFHRD